MRNSDVAHKFFYQNGTENFDRRNMSVSFYGDTYYSYNTAIGQKVVDKKGEVTLLISDNTMTMTTSKHIGELRRACPYKYLAVPQKFGSHHMTIRSTVEQFASELAWASRQSMTRADNRYRFTHLYFNLFEFNETVEAEGASELIDQYTAQYRLIKDITKVKEDRKKEKELAKIAVIAERYKDTPLMVLIRGAYTTVPVPVARYEVKELLTTKYPNYSFIWVEGDWCITSQSITISSKEAIHIMKMYVAGKLSIGTRVADKYNVLAVEPEYVKVGCHKISKDNIVELLKEVQNVWTKNLD